MLLPSSPCSTSTSASPREKKKVSTTPCMATILQLHHHHHHHHLLLLLLLPLLLTSAAAKQPAPPSALFSPKDHFLLDCGATTASPLPDGRVFKTDAQSAPYLKAVDNVRASVPSAPGAPSPLYLTARVFDQDATFGFTLISPGWHWVRLHFFAVKYSDFDLATALFSVTTDEFVLLHTFSVENASESVLKEYLIFPNRPHLNLHFRPVRNSRAFVNAVEVVSAPDHLIPGAAPLIHPAAEASDLLLHVYQAIYRINVGGPAINSANDTLGRSWSPEGQFLRNPAVTKKASVSPDTIKYPKGTSKLIAPAQVYATADKLADAGGGGADSNITWNFKVVPAFDYFVRLHFCDIVSKSLNELRFNVYLNGHAAISGLDLSNATSGLATPYYKDFVLNYSTVGEMITVEVGPMKNSPGGVRDALLNGVEILKMSNSVGSLDGEFGVDGSNAHKSLVSKGAAAAAGLVVMFGAFVCLAAKVAKRQKRREDCQQRQSYSSWLIPSSTGNSTLMTPSKGGQSSQGKNRPSFSSAIGTGIGRCMSLKELQAATKKFDKNAVVGVGGFGNVYLGVLEDGTKVAVKRGNPQSEQGITEFHTEIHVLSKLRHRHLVSLIGYCEEEAEMILVYEYMANGPFRDHLYGSDRPPLSWKQRLEICIGAARGLHYLHTGTARGIIHRDVKTTNILLDDAFVAKVADFGLSKDSQTRVSTAVKGSFGYLDPDYFRCQQLTDKSDVYSFGVVLMEALCARAALDPSLPREQINLAEWALHWKRRGLIEKIIDPKIAGTINEDSLRKYVEIAEKCLADHGVDRLSMGEVLWNLEFALHVQEANPPDADGKPRPPREPGQPQPGAGEAEGSSSAGGDRDERRLEPTMSMNLDNSSTAMASELFAQLAGMQGR